MLMSRAVGRNSSNLSLKTIAILGFQQWLNRLKANTTGKRQNGSLRFTEISLSDEVLKRISKQFSERIIQILYRLECIQFGCDKLWFTWSSKMESATFYRQTKFNESSSWVSLVKPTDRKNEIRTKLNREIKLALRPLLNVHYVRYIG